MESRRFDRLPFARLLEVLPEYCFVSSPDGTIIRANLAACAHLGFAKEEISGKTLGDLYEPVTVARFVELAEKWSREGFLQNEELWMRSKDGQSRTVLLNAVAIPDENGSAGQIAVLAVAPDQSEQRFRFIANSAPVMIWMSGTDKSCTYFNDLWLAFTGKTLQAELGNGWSTGVHPEDLRACLDTYSRSFDRREPFEMDYRLRRHDGEYRWIRDKGVPVFAEDRSFGGYIGSCIDVTDQKAAEEVLSAISRKLIEAQERERTWIARELHDDINQRIALVSVQMDALKNELPDSSSSIVHRLEELRSSLMGIGNDVQALSRHLHSSRLEYLGLGRAASILCRELAEKNALEISFQSHGIPKRMSPDLALSLFRVLQEALQNAIKHSGSRRIEVNLAGEVSTIELAVRDYGVGFVPEGVPLTGGLGLISMRERLKGVKGTLVVDSRPHQGTLIRACVPFHTPPEPSELLG